MTTLEKIKADIANLTCDCINGMVNQYAVLQIIDKYAEQEPTKQREKELAEEWKCGYEMGFEEAKVFYEKEEPTSPCDLCIFVSMDGDNKYCGYIGECPARAKGW